MSTETMLYRLAEANPVPEHGLEVDDSMLLLAIRERSVDMSTSTEKNATKGALPSTNPEDPKRSTGWLVALAAFGVVIAVGAVVLLATMGTGTPSASPSTASEPVPVSVVVPGTEQWTDTGIDLSIDNSVLIEADGEVSPSSLGVPFYGPDGAYDRPDASVYNIQGIREGSNHAGLIGRIGEAGAPFEVGSDLRFEVDTEGRLFLGINDRDVGNNAGEFTATITVNP